MGSSRARRNPELSGFMGCLRSRDKVMGVFKHESGSIKGGLEMNFASLFVVAVLLVAGCNDTALDRSLFKITSAPGSGTGAVRSGDQSVSGAPEAMSISQQTVEVEGSVPSCLNIDGKPVLGPVSIGTLRNPEKSQFDTVQNMLKYVYDRAVQAGLIDPIPKPGPQLVQKYLMDVCSVLPGIPFDSSSKLKCFAEKKSVMPDGILAYCKEKNWFLPANFHIVSVTLRKESSALHHFLAVFVERIVNGKPGLYYLGNVDPWGNPNNPAIVFGTNNILKSPGDYECREIGLPRKV